jgi:hypothetical protein
MALLLHLCRRPERSWLIADTASERNAAVDLFRKGSPTYTYELMMYLVRRDVFLVSLPTLSVSGETK